MFRWVKKLHDWAFEKKPKSSIKILEEYHNQGISVFRYIDHSVPGIVETWRIHRHKEKLQFFVCAVNISRMKEDLSVRPHKNNDQYIHREIATKLKQETSYATTHYWLCGTIQELYSVAENNGNPTPRTKILCSIAGDFQGISRYLEPNDPDRYIKQINRQIIRQLSSNEFREFGHHRSWKSAVVSIDFYLWVEGLSRKFIDRDHNLKVIIQKSDRK